MLDVQTIYNELEDYKKSDNYTQDKYLNTIKNFRKFVKNDILLGKLYAKKLAKFEEYLSNYTNLVVTYGMKIINYEHVKLITTYPADENMKKSKIQPLFSQEEIRILETIRHEYMDIIYALEKIPDANPFTLISKLNEKGIKDEKEAIPAFIHTNYFGNPERTKNTILLLIDEFQKWLNSNEAQEIRSNMQENNMKNKNGTINIELPQELASCTDQERDIYRTFYQNPQFTVKAVSEGKSLSESRINDIINKICTKLEIDENLTSLRTYINTRKNCA